MYYWYWFLYGALYMESWLVYKFIFNKSLKKVDNSIGFILEFKLASSVSEMEEMAIIAIKQMKKKEYYKELIYEGVKGIKEIAMVFCVKKIIVR